MCISSASPYQNDTNSLRFSEYTHVVMTKNFTESIVLNVENNKKKSELLEETCHSAICDTQNSGTSL